jgi:hypothetical protein
MTNSFRKAIDEAQPPNLTVIATARDKSLNYVDGRIIYVIIFSNNDEVYVWKGMSEKRFVEVYVAVDVGKEYELMFNGDAHRFLGYSNIREINGMRCM